MTVNDFLFNFSVSYSGGGYKRLYAYSEWFNQNGGARFIIHPRSHSLINKFPNNHFIIVKQTLFQRVFNDCNYLDGIQKEFGTPQFYFSYGIPVYYKFGKINWFHLSNVLPLIHLKLPISTFDRLKFNFLGRKIKHNFRHADVISAESDFSLSLIDIPYNTKKALSVNGSDDELLLQKMEPMEKFESIATVIGTYRYKAIEDAFHVFEMLKAKDTLLKLVIIGNEEHIPKWLRKHKDVLVKGSLERTDVINYLRKTKYYISTTYIENSYNAASEGIFIAQESFISDIGPHKELIAGMPFEEISVPNMKRPILHLKREQLSTYKLKTWSNVIADMLDYIDKNS